MAATPKAQSIKENIDKLDFTKILKICSSKGAITGVNR